MEEGIYARISTPRGEILAELFYQKVPLTVANFVGLAEGKIDNDAQALGEPFYDGLKFHRVIPDFMVQTGDPEGTGAGGPGYRFPDEIDSSLKHNAPGTLSMANAGPGTNGSQFFITHTETPWLDGKHSVFGKVITGQDVVNAIEQGDTMDRVRIERIGMEAEEFDPRTTFNAELEKQKEVKHDREQESLRELDALSEGFETTPSGLRYNITQKGSGPKAEKGKTVQVHYQGQLINGNVFDDSKERGKPIGFRLGEGKVIKAWDEGIALLSEGDEARFIAPPHLAYGELGAGSVIPPNSWLIFDVKLMEVS